MFFFFICLCSVIPLEQQTLLTTAFTPYERGGLKIPKLEEQHNLLLPSVGPTKKQHVPG